MVPTSSPRVSVIVPVWNPGPHFDDLMASFAGQTLEPHEFEVLLCDDGSDEVTHARLDRAERAHANVRVLRLEHTGWPGKPRNAGIEAARGTYVFFCDHDDQLGADALRRMCDYADENSSDVLVPKVVGVGRGLSRRLYRKNVPHAELTVDPLLDVLTPHKLFRTEFVRAEGIRFPDERVRLEDHMFVMQAYFKAGTISILGDYPCYYWMKREDKPSASATRIDPVTYFPHLRTVLDIVEANTQPGERRNSLLQHWYRGKVLKRLSGKQFLGYDVEYRELFLSVIVPLVQERFGPELDVYLAFPMRVRSALLRAGRIDDLLTLARIEAGMVGHAEVTSLRWSAAKRLIIEVSARVTDADGEPLIFEKMIRDDEPQPPAPPVAGSGEGVDGAGPADAVPAAAALPVAGSGEGVDGAGPADAVPAAAALPVAGSGEEDAPAAAGLPVAGSGEEVADDEVVVAGSEVVGEVGEEAAGLSQVWRSSELPPSPILVDEVMDAGGDLARDGLSVFLRDKSDGADYHQKVRGRGLTAVVTVDPRNARDGRRVTSRSELVAQVRHAGWAFMVPLRVSDDVWPTDESSLQRIIGQRELTVERTATGKLALRARQLTTAELTALNPPAPTGLGARAAKALDQLAASVPERAREKVPQPARRLARGLRKRLRGR